MFVVMIQVVVALEMWVGTLILKCG